MNVTYTAYLRDIFNNFIAKVTSWNSLAVEEHFADVGTASIKIPPSAPCAPLLASTYAMAITRTDAYGTKTLVSGPIAKPIWHFDEKGTEIEVQFRDWMSLLKDRVVYPSASTGTAPGNLTFTATNDTYPTSGTGAASEDALYHYVDYNIGPSAQVSRQNALVALTTSLSRGANVKVSARFKQNLLKLLQTIIYADPTMGYSLVEQADGSLLFTAAPVRDLTASVVLCKTNGTLRDVQYDIERPIANYVLVLGSGAGTSRTIYAVSNTASIAKWGLIEGVYNYSATNNADTMKTLANAYLNENSEIYSLACQINNTAMYVCGRDYQLGDKITVIEPSTGTTYQQIVRSVQYHVDASGGEVITPVIATPAKRHGIKKTRGGALIINDRVGDLESAA